MTPAQHLTITAMLSKRVRDYVYALLPDTANVLLVTRREWLPESHPYVRASRVLHSPIVVLALIVATRGRAWAYGLHWLCDAATHERGQWLWPFYRG